MTIFCSAASRTFFFTSYVVAKSPETNNFFAKVKRNWKISLQNGRLRGQRSAEQNWNSKTRARRNEGEEWHFCKVGGERVDMN